jgi:hypothetical protein
MKKESAVEWLESELDFLSNYMSERDRSKLFEQAKEMEEGQIALAYSTGALEGVNENFTNGYTYYKKTYK